MDESKEIKQQSDKIIFCHKCHTAHKKIDIPKGKSIKCRECGTIFYRNDDDILLRNMALGITNLILFLVSNTFPLIKMAFLGQHQHVSILSMIASLFEEGFYVVGTIVLLCVFVFPLITLLAYLLFFWLMIIKKGKNISKKLLILFSKLLPWSMSEIFLVAVLVSVVKLTGYLQIEIGVSFWSLVAFVLFDVYLVKSMRIDQLWELRYRIFHGKQ